MKYNEKSRELFVFLAAHGETKAEVICKKLHISKNYLMALVSTIRDRHNQGVHTVMAGGELSYRLNVDYPYTFEDFE